MNLRLVRFIDIYIGIPLVCAFALLKKIFRKKDSGNTPGNCRKILLIKFWGIGNIAMVLPSARALKKSCPHAKLDLLTLSSNRDIAKASDTFDDIHTIDNTKLGRFIATVPATLTTLRKSGYDIIIDFEQFARFSALLCMAIGSKKTIGFATKNQARGYAYTHPVQYDNDRHMTRSFFSLAERAGAGTPYQITPAPFLYKGSDAASVENILQKLGSSSKETLVLMPIGTGENFIERRWPPEYFADLADRLISSFGVKVVFAGTQSETSLIRQAKERMKNKESLVDLGGALNFAEYIALLSMSRLVISADTAHVHLATAMSVPVAALYGPNTPKLYGPWGGRSIWFYKALSCSPCITNYNAKIADCKNTNGRGACMRGITVDEVFTAIKKNYFDKDAPFGIIR